MRILAIDLGTKRIGLALSDPLGLTAQSLPTLMRAHSEADFEYLKRLISAKKIEKCVVGLPLRLSGEIGPAAKETLEWVEIFKTKISLEVTTWDERLTTREATRLMIQQDLSRKKRKEKADELAAILILQGYLEFNRPRPQC